MRPNEGPKSGSRDNFRDNSKGHEVAHCFLTCGVRLLDEGLAQLFANRFGGAILLPQHPELAPPSPSRDSMGWEMIPWYTITDNFDADFDVSEWHGTNVFFRDGDKIYRTYFINNRGDEQMGGTWNYLDITPLGRQEEWEDSPEGYPQTQTYKWWNWHDSYVEGAAPDKRWVEISDAGEAAFRQESASAKR